MNDVKVLNDNFFMEVKMFKNSIIIALVVLMFLIGKELIFNNKINWIDNVGISIIVFLAYVFLQSIRKSGKN